MRKVSSFPIETHHPHPGVEGSTHTHQGSTGIIATSREHCGTIKLYDLGVPEALKGHKPMLRVMEREDYRDLLEKPSVSSHKYNRGVLGMLTEVAIIPVLP